MKNSTTTTASVAVANVGRLVIEVQTAKPATALCFAR